MSKYDKHVPELEENLAREMWDVVQKYKDAYLDEELSPPFSTMDLEPPTKMVDEATSKQYDVLMQTSTGRKLTLPSMPSYLGDYQ